MYVAAREDLLYKTGKIIMQFSYLKTVNH